jgi:tRNA-binding protein
MNPAPIKSQITIDDLLRVDIRLGTIEAVSEVEKSDKLVCLTVDFGDHKRTILSGIKKERPNFKDLEGRQTLFVVNLAPRKMAGLISEGMLFDTGFADGVQPAIVAPERPMPNGTRAE